MALKLAIGVAAAIAALFAFVVMIAAQTAAHGEQGCGSFGGTGGGTSLETHYRAAAAKYGLGDTGWAVLGSINKVETEFGRNVKTSSAGAKGWMQFMPATWSQYGVDGDGDGDRDWNDPADAIHSAANYLKANGAAADAPESKWRAAIFRYNHASSYVEKVWRFAQGYLRAGRVTDAPAEGAGPPQGAPPTTGRRVVATSRFYDARGYKGDVLARKPDTYAELGGKTEAEANLLGGLPYMHALRVTNRANGKSMVLYKRDFGLGPPKRTEMYKGHRVAIDIYDKAAKQLGLGDRGLVEIEPADGGDPGAVTSSPSSGECADSGGGTLRERIIAEAEKTLTSKTGYSYYSQKGAMTEDPMPARGLRSDCSQWVRAIYLKAGAQDPGANTYGQIARGRRTSEPKPGDLMMAKDGGHVELYIGNGETIGHGSPPIDKSKVGNWPGHYFVTFDWLDAPPSPGN